MDRQDLRKGFIGAGLKRGGSLIAASMTPAERSLRSKKAAATRNRGKVKTARGQTLGSIDRRAMIDSVVASRLVSAQARSAEPEITESVKEVITQFGGRMESLEHRLKTVDSMARKIFTKSRERGQTIGEAAERISDAVRYTGVIDEPPPGAYADAIRNVVSTLEKRNMKILEVDAHWGRGGGYNAIHLIVQHPNGTKAEIQFHTSGSLAAKKKTHEIYERSRLPTVSKQERAAMLREMVEIGNQVPVPKGALEVSAQVFRPGTVN